VGSVLVVTVITQSSPAAASTGDVVAPMVAAGATGYTQTAARTDGNLTTTWAIGGSQLAPVQPGRADHAAAQLEPGHLLTQRHQHRQRRPADLERDLHGVAQHPEGLWRHRHHHHQLQPSGQQPDPARVRPVDHKGRFFSCRGPLNIPRSPQGRPMIIQAGSSARGQDFAARWAEIVFSIQPEE
jgi:hypothetical protein